MALGLASNVIQFVEFSINATDKLRQIYKNGATIEQKDLASTADHLSAVTTGLRVSLRNAQTHKALSRSETQLLDLADRCMGTASKLHAELDKISKQPDSGIRALLKKMTISMRRARTINELSEQLREDRCMLETSLLMTLHGTALHIVADQGLLYERLGVAEKHIIARLASGATSLSDLLKAEGSNTRHEIIHQHDKTRGHVTREVGRLEIRLLNMNERKDLLESLHFPEINLRYDQIKPAFADTFEFIFDDSEKDRSHWDSFVDWLRSERDLYRIQGKLGSGKSSLMSFLSEDPRTLENAFASQQLNRQKVQVTFFFWNAGSVLQKSVEGLMRSLIYQLLDSDPPLYDRMLTRDPALERLNPKQVWSAKALKSLLNAAIEHVETPVLVLLDGLDEFDHDINDLISIIGTLRGIKNVKLCLSSRPVRRLETTFEGCDGLRLQYLTRNSIRTYIGGVLEKNADFRQFQGWQQSEGEAQKSDLVAAILDKAHGVFLWVELVVSAILEGINNMDTWDILFQRVEETPEGVESLYDRMWARCPKLYQQDAMHYFQLVLERKMSLLEFTIATSSDIQSAYLDNGGNVSDAEIIQRCRERRVHLMARCVGFLEIFPTRPEYLVGPLKQPIEDVEESRLSGPSLLRAQHQWHSVGFIHRTAAEYVRAKVTSGLTQDLQPQVPCLIDLLTKVRCVLWKMDPKAFENMSSDIAHSFGWVRGDDNAFRIPATAMRLAQKTFEEITQTPPRRSQDLYQNKLVATDFFGWELEDGVFPDSIGDVIDLSVSTPEYLTYLVACVCATGVYFPDLNGIVRVVCTLLEAGANPMGQIQDPCEAPSKLSRQVVPWCSIVLGLWTCLTLDATRAEWVIMELAISEFLYAGAVPQVLMPFLCFLEWDEGLKSFHPTFSRLGIEKGKLAFVISGNASSFVRRLELAKLCNDNGNTALSDCTSNDVFEVVLIRYDGQWVRINSKHDSDVILAYVAESLNPSGGSDCYQSLIKVLGSQDHYFAGTSSDAKAQLGKVLARSLTITDDMPYATWRIPGWTATTLPMLAHYLLLYNSPPSETMEKVLLEMGLPRQFLELAEIPEIEKELEAEQELESGKDREREELSEGGEESKGGEDQEDGKESQGGEASRMAEAKRIED